MEYYLSEDCVMCKKKINYNSNYITIRCSKFNRYDKEYLYFHRFCYFNYRTEYCK